ncbi:hypothetical protein [Prosthecobacter vanneervenii]|uniref:Uncharacterized protein n=1 Tax=Prosthecobacter vanneervenii TaxID=48466 RepID=A0A7W8DJ12_9BACT|nr:hypothetical protein [Prosthecobacter vanneervenii]MBB5031550.1 hypothetical protein [Prosthecobacter vanneervenii]
MKKLHSLFLLLLACTLPAYSQVVDPGVPLVTIAEGPIKGLVRNADGTVLMTIMGVPVILNANTRVRTPMAVLTFNQLMSITKMPGRNQRGFMNGTALARGFQDANGVMTAVDVLVQPAENVVVGMITKNSGGLLEMNQMPVKFCMDARMPSRGAMNGFAIPIDLASVTVGSTASVEGYYDDASTFQSINLYIDTLAPPLSRAPQVAFIVTRAVENIPNTKKGDTLDIRGGVTFFHDKAALTQSINLYRIDNNVATFLGSAVATRSLVYPDYGLWRFNGTTFPTADPVLGNAPTVIRAVNTSAGANMAFTEDIVDVR